MMHMQPLLCQPRLPGKRLMAASALGYMVLVAAPSWAQSAANTAGPVAKAPSLSGDTGNSAPEVVIVTARRKSERLQNVPLSITALSAQQLKAANATSLQDITFLTPGLT